MDPGSEEWAPSAVTFVERVRLWAVRRANEDEVVRAAADAAAQGVGGPAVGELAGLPWDPMHADFEQVVRSAVEELGRTLPPRDSDESRLLGLAAMSRQCLDGELSPMDLAAWAHLAFDWPNAPPEAATLEELYYAYDEDVDVTEDQADRQVLAEAKRLVERLL